MKINTDLSNAKSCDAIDREIFEHAANMNIEGF